MASLPRLFLRRHACDLEQRAPHRPPLHRDIPIFADAERPDDLLATCKQYPRDPRRDFASDVPSDWSLRHREQLRFSLRAAEGGLVATCRFWELLALLRALQARWCRRCRKN